MNPGIFRAYDIRGIYPIDFNEATAYAIGQAYAHVFRPREVVVGRDVRLSGYSLWQALTDGLTDAGVDVVNVGTISTDMLYFAVAHYHFDGGLTVSASHNPREYNGVKMVREKSTAISSDTGLFTVRDVVLEGYHTRAAVKGRVRYLDFLDDYLKHVLSFIDPAHIKPAKVVLNANFGLAGQVAEKLLSLLPRSEKGEPLVASVPLNVVPDGSFPKGRPDPMIESNREETVRLIRAEEADFGVAWDADADRCFFFDERGGFVSGYFVTALLAEALLVKYPGGKIIYDPRLVWAIEDTVKRCGGIPLINKSGHAFFKDRMRQEEALFGGESSAHYYFDRNFFCDNGMIPFLLLLERLSETGQRLSQLAAPLRAKYFAAEETNFDLKSDEAVETKIKEVEARYSNGHVEHIDGLSVAYGREWRFNLRPSNTEPLLRLNVEAKSQELLEQKFAELKGLIEE